MFSLRIVVPGVATVLIVVLAWRRARQPGPTARANQRWLLLAGCGLVAIATLLVVGEFETGLLWLATVAALLALVLVRSFAMPARTTGAATLVAAGSVNALCWLARILGDPQTCCPTRPGCSFGSSWAQRASPASPWSACGAGGQCRARRAPEWPERSRRQLTTSSATMPAASWPGMSQIIV